MAVLGVRKQKRGGSRWPVTAGGAQGGPGFGIMTLAAVFKVCRGCSFLFPSLPLSLPAPLSVNLDGVQHGRQAGGAGWLRAGRLGDWRRLRWVDRLAAGLGAGVFRLRPSVSAALRSALLLGRWPWPSPSVTVWPWWCLGWGAGCWAWCPCAWVGHDLGQVGRVCWRWPWPQAARKAVAIRTNSSNKVCTV